MCRSVVIMHLDLKLWPKFRLALRGNRVRVIYTISDATKLGNYVVQAKYETFGHDKFWLMLEGCRPTAKPENVLS
jgi:hypothetical protein